MTGSELIAKIIGGEYDADLSLLLQAVTLRNNVKGIVAAAPIHNSVVKSIRDFKVGGKVVFNENANPKYLEGCVATIVKTNRTRVVIKLDAPVGRFSTTPIRCPISIIEKVNV